MKKIPTIFKRNPNNLKEILAEPHPDCEWVFKGEGVAMRKYDGTCCMVKNKKLWKRREIKKGKTIPEQFILVDYDEITGKTVGWMPVEDNKQDCWYKQAFCDGDFPDGTYELCGEKVQGNPEGLVGHILIAHKDAIQYDNFKRTFNGIKKFLATLNIEGFVFHHPDGRMAKIKKRDYGLSRK